MAARYAPFVLLPSLLFAMPCVAQPTITSSDLQPSVVTTFNMVSETYEAPPPGGANVTWDLSGFSNGSGINYIFEQVAGQPLISSYPGTNAVIRVDGTWDYDQRLYWQHTATGRSDMGSFMQQISQEDLSNPRQTLQFPLTFGTNWTDAYAGTWANFGNSCNRSGNMATTVDGWGTLILPTGTYDDVLRVGTLMLTADNYGFFVLNHTHVVVEFYKAGCPLPLVRYSDDLVISTAGDTNVVRDLDWVGNLDVSVLETAADGIGLTVFPSPASDVVHLRTEDGANGPVDVMILDAVGRVVKRTQWMRGSSESLFSIDVATFPPAVYTVVLRTETGATVRRPFIVQ